MDEPTRRSAKTPKTHWIDVRVLMREADAKELLPGDRVWYRVRLGRPYERHTAHGPFTVTSVKPFVLQNSSGVDVTLDARDLILLVPCSSG